LTLYIHTRVEYWNTGHDDANHEKEGHGVHHSKVAKENFGPMGTLVHYISIVNLAEILAGI
jgi:hypothetical protein